MKVGYIKKYLYLIFSYDKEGGHLALLGYDGSQSIPISPISKLVSL